MAKRRVRFSKDLGTNQGAYAVGDIAVFEEADAAKIVATGSAYTPTSKPSRCGRP